MACTNCFYSYKYENCVFKKFSQDGTLEYAKQILSYSVLNDNIGVVLVFTDGTTDAILFDKISSPYFATIADWLNALCLQFENCSAGSGSSGGTESIVIKEYCRIEDSAIVMVDVRTIDGVLQYNDLQNGSIHTYDGFILLYATKCKDSGKSKVEPYIRELTGNDKITISTTELLDQLVVTMNDISKCHYVRITFICPDGILGCALLAPYVPQQALSLNSYEGVSEICLEVVERDLTNTDIKTWSVIAPENPIEVLITGMDS